MNWKGTHYVAFASLMRCFQAKEHFNANIVKSYLWRWEIKENMNVFIKVFFKFLFEIIFTIFFV